MTWARRLPQDDELGRTGMKRHTTGAPVGFPLQSHCREGNVSCTVRGRTAHVSSTSCCRPPRSRRRVYGLGGNPICPGREERTNMRIGLCAPAVFCAGAVAALLSAGAASAAPITITSLTQDFEPRVSLVNGSTSPGPSTTAPSVRVGISGANSNRTYTNSLFFLPLPALTAGQTITSANFGFTHLPETLAAPAAN